MPDALLQKLHLTQGRDEHSQRLQLPRRRPGSFHVDAGTPLRWRCGGPHRFPQIRQRRPPPCTIQIRLSIKAR